MLKVIEHQAIYVCVKGRLGDGIAISLDGQPTMIQRMMAESMISDCEGRNRRVDGSVHPENGECPSSCPLRQVASGDLSVHLE